MATVTTDFPTASVPTAAVPTASAPTASVPRSRAERLADGVIAGYIRALDGAAVQASALASAQTAILAADSAMNVTASHRHNNKPQRTTGPWSRGPRGGCSNQAKRLLEAR